MEKDIISNLKNIFSHTDANELFIRGLSFLIQEQLYQHHLSKQDIRKSLHTLTEQLSDAIKKITDIATINGFNNISYFNREFMKLMKMTPSEYRKSMVPPL